MVILQTQLSKVLAKKREKVSDLKRMNADVEQMSSQNVEPQPHFQQEYANVVLDLETINAQLNDELKRIEAHCQEVNNTYACLLGDFKLSVLLCLVTDAAG